MHHAVLHTCRHLEKMGFEVTYVDVDEEGILKLEDLKKAVRPDTILISVMFANNCFLQLSPVPWKPPSGSPAPDGKCCLHCRNAL